MVPQTLATYFVTDYSDTTTVSGGMSAWMWVVTFAVVVVMIASMWQIYTKAGRPGWAAIIPVYNTLQLIWTAGKPWWWIILLFIPFVNIIALIVLYYNLAKAFGKGVGYTLLLILLPIIGFPMLAWGGATYKLKKPKNGM
ncbi:MAG: DUF5684 domain-containing protein [Candidatus Saccharimonadales bacterium]